MRFHLTFKISWKYFCSACSVVQALFACVHDKCQIQQLMFLDKNKSMIVHISFILFKYVLSLLLYAENDKMRIRTIPKRQTSYPTEAETHGSSDTSKNSDGQLYPARSSSYPSSSGYSGNSGYPSSGSSRTSDSTNQPRSGYPSSDSVGYPSSGSPTSYPSSRSSGYPTSGSSGYPSSGSSGYPSSQSSGYPSSRSSGYSLSESSSYPSRDSSGYPTGSVYSSRNSGSSGYPDNSRNPYGEEIVRRAGANTVNAGYPSYPRTSVYPEGNLSYRNNYPAQNTGYPYNNQHPSYSNQGYFNGYPQNYPQGGQYPEGYYQGQNYMTTTKRPGIRDQLTNFARNVAEKVLTQTILDRITGKHQ